MPGCGGTKSIIALWRLWLQKAGYRCQYCENNRSGHDHQEQGLIAAPDSFKLTFESKVNYRWSIKMSLFDDVQGADRLVIDVEGLPENLRHSELFCHGVVSVAVAPPRVRNATSSTACLAAATRPARI